MSLALAETIQLYASRPWYDPLNSVEVEALGMWGALKIHRGITEQRDDEGMVTHTVQADVYVFVNPYGHVNYWAYLGAGDMTLEEVAVNDTLLLFNEKPQAVSVG